MRVPDTRTHCSMRTRTAFVHTLAVSARSHVRRAIHTVRSYMARTRRTIQVKADAGWCSAVAVLKQRGIPLHFLDREVTIKAAFSVAAHCFHRAELQEQFCLACEEICRELGSDFLCSSICFPTSSAGWHNKSIYLAQPFSSYAAKDQWCQKHQGQSSISQQ